MSENLKKTFDDQIKIPKSQRNIKYLAEIKDALNQYKDDPKEFIRVLEGHGIHLMHKKVLSKTLIVELLTSYFDDPTGVSYARMKDTTFSSVDLYFSRLGILFPIVKKGNLNEEAKAFFSNPTEP